MLVIALTAWLPTSAAGEDTAVVKTTVVQVQKLLADNDRLSALSLIREARAENPQNNVLADLHADILFQMDRLVPARELIESRPERTPAMRDLLVSIDKKTTAITRNYNLTVIFIQKRIEQKDFPTALYLVDLAFAKFPDKQVQLFNLKGEALYKNNQLEAAEVEFRKALKIDPLDAVAKSYVAEIRSTLEAQTSTELAEWISIAKDKVGDFIVTFLALFAAFLANALISPIALRIKLNRARAAFDEGDYDDFTDLIEGLLDKEDFSPLRANLRYVLKRRGYEEVREIFNKYVVTLDRLPTLLRVLEREHEKILEGG